MAPVDAVDGRRRVSSLLNSAQLSSTQLSSAEPFQRVERRGKRSRRGGGGDVHASENVLLLFYGCVSVSVYLCYFLVRHM